MKLVEWLEKHDHAIRKLQGIVDIISDSNMRLGAEIIQIDEVTDDISIVLDYIRLLETEYLGMLEEQHGTKKNV